MIKMKKDEIISRLHTGRENFLDAIQGLSDQEMESQIVGDLWTVKDIIIHLTRWEAELIKLLWQAKNNVEPSTAQLSPQSVDEINARWYSESKTRGLELAMPDFIGVRDQTIRRVKSFSDSELNDQELFPWLDGSPLWKWIADDSYEHETEHEAQIRIWRRKEAEQE
jgi:hypothetical protein